MMPRHWYWSRWGFEQPSDSLNVPLSENVNSPTILVSKWYSESVSPYLQMINKLAVVAAGPKAIDCSSRTKCRAAEQLPGQFALLWALSCCCYNCHKRDCATQKDISVSLACLTHLPTRLAYELRSLLRSPGTHSPGMTCTIAHIGACSALLVAFLCCAYFKQVAAPPDMMSDHTRCSGSS